MVGSVSDLVSGVIAVGSMGGDTRAVTAGETEKTVDSRGSQDAQEVAMAAKIKKDIKEAEEAELRDKPVTEEDASYITEQLNKLMSRINANISFQYHKEIDFMAVKMLDKTTNEVIREVPAEDLIKHMIHVHDWIGAFLDKKA